MKFNSLNKQALGFFTILIPFPCSALRPYWRGAHDGSLLDLARHRAAQCAFFSESGKHLPLNFVSSLWAFRIFG